METGHFRTLRPRDIPKVLALLIRIIPYIITFATLCLAMAFISEQSAPRGTFAYMTRQGIAPDAMVWLAGLCGLIGLLGWRIARRSLFWSCVLCVVICVPMVIYSYYGTRYLTTEVQGSYATLVMFWTCCLVCIVFVFFVILLAAWMEVSKFTERQRG